MTSTEKAPQSSKEDQPLPLDPYLFNPSDGEISFFREQTGIKDRDEIISHISKIQQEAYEVRPYPCIRLFEFARFRIVSHPAYKAVLERGRGSDAIFLEIGCCFGTDVRKLISDGFPKEKVVATDIVPEFWDLGHKLCKTTLETFKVPFVCGSILDDELLDTTSPTSSSLPDFASLKTLTPLRGHVNFIHIALVFHLFDEATQSNLARRLASVLSPEPGSMIFGRHMGRPEKGTGFEAIGMGGRGADMFCHSDKSWKELWDGEIFEKGKVRVDASLEKIETLAGVPLPAQVYMLTWSVTRI